ncbi:MAG: 3-hydroxyacyl-CoA dehydrogenase [Betaproteobacteria bacterium RIFCSPLOWO2_02_FULL_63_19]|nr:MAG: 3-hydroxyacyl-CoA dehydrogenase [Betaproteobacteria bacterium RIFCSPLOWO2_02_FULL_63_19]
MPQDATSSPEFDPMRADLTLGIIGTGIMGRGIAQIAAQSGIRVLLYDTRADAAPAAVDYVAGVLAKLVEKARIDAAAAKSAVANLQVARSLPELSGCDVVIEAIVENLDAKRELFGQLEALVRATCILATNTSSLQVTSIAAGCKNPERVAGYHFFNPVPLMKVVEVIDAVMTAPWVGDALAGLTRRMGHKPVRARDTPGFIVNHAGRGYLTEALRVASEGVADFHEIDRILREGTGFRMGPFELLDLTGLDVSHPVMESIYNQYYQEPRYRPSPITGQRLNAGLIGRKTGRGFYRYQAGAQEKPATSAAPAARPTRVWVSSRGLGAALQALVAKLGASMDTGAAPAADSLCLVAPLGQDATNAALAEALDPARTVAVDCLFATDKRRTLMTTPVTRGEMRDAAHGLLASDGVPVSVIHDSPGFVSQRVVAQIVNIACDIAQQRIASAQDIDTAVTLGLGYPKGPLAWGDALEPARILAVLDRLNSFYGDPRYRASPWLKRRALLGVSLLTAEG